MTFVEIPEIAALFEAADAHIADRAKHIRPQVFEAARRAAFGVHISSRARRAGTPFFVNCRAAAHGTFIAQDRFRESRDTAYDAWKDIEITDHFAVEATT